MADDHAQLKSTPLFQSCSSMFLEGLKAAVELVSVDPGEVFVRQGEPVDALYLVRSGFVKLTQDFGEDAIVVSYLSKGMTLGEAELLMPEVDAWESTASSVEYAELVKLPRLALEQLLRAYPDAEEQLWQTAADRIREAGYAKRNIAHSELTQVALDWGLVQGSSMLVINNQRALQDAAAAAETEAEATIDNLNNLTNGINWAGKRGDIDIVRSAPVCTGNTTLPGFSLTNTLAFSALILMCCSFSLSGTSI